MVSVRRQRFSSVMNIDRNPMNDIRQELLRLIALNHQEQWVPDHLALQQLDQYGDRLIPGLVLALGDTDEEVRQLAMSLLDEAGTRSAPALSAIIKMLAVQDRVVRVVAANCLQKFGPLAIDAVPLLRPWLRGDHEYVRLLAAVTISTIAPIMKDEMLPVIRAATGSDNPLVSSLAEEFLADR